MDMSNIHDGVSMMKRFVDYVEWKRTKHVSRLFVSTGTEILNPPLGSLGGSEIQNYFLGCSGGSEITNLSERGGKCIFLEMLLV